MSGYSAVDLIRQTVPSLWMDESKDKHRDFQVKYFDHPGLFTQDCFTWNKERKPTDYQLEILDTIPTARRVCVRSPHGAGKCSLYTNLIRMADGSLAQASNLIGKSFDVLSIDSEMKVIKARAYATDNGKRDVIEITTDKGRQLIVTLNHPLWGDVEPRHWTKPECSLRLRPEGSWVQAQELRPGSAIAVYMGCPINEYGISDAEIKFIAYMMGDGYMNTGFSFSQLPGVILDDMNQTCKELGIRLSGSIKDWHLVGIDENGRSLARTLLEKHSMVGRKSVDQKFPDFVWQLGRRQLSLFLSCLYGCEGWVTCQPASDGKTRRNIGFTVISQQLARDVHSSLLRLGIQANLVKRKTLCTNAANGPKRGVAWTVAICNAENILLFLDNIGMVGKENNCNVLRASCDTASDDKTQKWRSYTLPDYLRWEKVKKLRIIRDQKTVAISVPETENYLTDFVEHNTALASWSILWFALTRDEYCDWKVPTTASAWRQLTKFLWPEIRKWSRLIRWDVVGRSPFSETTELLTLNLRLHTGEAFALASDDSNNIEGAHADQLMYVFDESKIIPPETWDSAEGAMSSGNTFFLSISTPGEPVGRFYDIQMRKSGYKDWHVRHVTLQEAISANRISTEWATSRRIQWGESSAIFQNRVKGDFASSAEDVIIPLSWVELAQNRWAEADIPTNVDQIGCDVARSGSDKNVIARRSGNYIHDLDKELISDTAEISGRIKSLLTFHPYSFTVIDVIGVGAGVYDSVNERFDDRTHAYHAQYKTEYEDVTGQWQFNDTYSAMWWRLRDMLNPINNFNVALPPDDDLTEDLVSPKWKVLSNGRIQVEPKEKIKDRIQKSPDCGEAVCMAFWIPDPDGMDFA